MDLLRITIAGVCGLAGFGALYFVPHAALGLGRAWRRESWLGIAFQASWLLLAADAAVCFLSVAARALAAPLGWHSLAGALWSVTGWSLVVGAVLLQVCVWLAWRLPPSGSGGETAQLVNAADDASRRS